MRSQSSISLNVEQLKGRDAPSSINGVPGGISPALVSSAAASAPVALIASQATKDSGGPCH
jgi:hypothetical protein